MRCQKLQNSDLKIGQIFLRIIFIDLIILKQLIFLKFVLFLLACGLLSFTFFMIICTTWNSNFKRTLAPMSLATVQKGKRGNPTGLWFLKTGRKSGPK